MAQLSDTSAGRFLTFGSVFSEIGTLVSAVGDRERVSLGDALGRVCAETVVSAYDLPPFDNSAVDGYAVALADLAEHRTLALSGRVAAGDSDGPALVSGTAMRIFTGAQLPQGADTVFMQEDVEADHAHVTFPQGLKRGANTRQRGEDLRAGAVAIPAGRRLRAQDLALAAAIGLQTLPVVRHLRVALFSTGDELLDQGASQSGAQRFDSNRIMLAALLAAAKVHVTDLGIVPDDRAAIVAVLSAASHAHDLVLTTGGVSVGEEDHVKAAVAEVGAIALWRLAIKPGRPIAIGRVGQTPFVGLPGNPVAAFVTFARIIRPVLARLAGETYVQTQVQVTAGFSHRKKKGPREYVRVRVERDASGALVAKKHPTEGAAILMSLTETTGLVELVENVVEVSPGDILDYLPYEGLI